MKLWRNFALAYRKYENLYLLEEDTDLKIFEGFHLSRLSIPFVGRLDLKPAITEHLRETRAQWLAITIGDVQMVNQTYHQRIDDTDDDFAIDEVGLLNLESAMEE